MVKLVEKELDDKLVLVLMLELELVLTGELAGVVVEVQVVVSTTRLTVKVV